MSNTRFSITQARAVGDREITDDMFRVLSAFGLFSDKEGWCWPSQETIAEIVGTNRQKVNGIVSRLVDLGYMEKKHRFAEDGGQLSNMYRLLFDSPPVREQATLVTPPVIEVEGIDYTNAPLNAPSNNTANEEKPSSLPMDWKIATGQPITEQDLALEVEKKRIDTANLIAMGMGGKRTATFGIAYEFMKTRGILIPEKKIKAQRKAVTEMVDMGVLPHHVKEATEKLLAAGMTVTDLYSVAKTAIAIANPAPEQTEHGFVEGV